MTYEFYKVLHLAGLIGLFASVGAIALVSPEKRKPFMIVHGVSLTVMLVAGFGLLARLELVRELPLWANLKLGIWILLGGLPVLFKKKPRLAMPLFFVAIALGAAAAWIAVNKPS